MFKLDGFTFFENGVVSLNLPIAADVIGARLQIAPAGIVECHVPPYEPDFRIELLQPQRAA